MIQSSELRIGNIVNTDKGIGEVTALYKYGKEEYRIGVTVPPLLRYHYTNPNVSGIPLTPEILEKCGFKLAADQYGGWLSPMFLQAAGSSDGYQLRIVLLDGIFVTGGSHLIQINSLHELQNWFYWNSNKQELNYTP